MLISKQSLLSTNNRNYKKYKELGYTFNIGDKILVDIEHLNKSSRSIVNAKCDVCGVEREITYSVYYCNTEKYNIYTCVGKCSNIKYKMTNLEKFGVEYPLQNKKIKNDLSNYFTYELDFIKFCIENNLEIKKASKIKYKNIDGLDSYYFPDFYLPNFNLIIEIKSSYYFKLEESKNIYKKNASINSGYNFLFIIDKDYKELKKIINN